MSRENKIRRHREPLLPPSVLAARSKEMRQRLSASSLVLGGVGREPRDWSLSSAQLTPTDLGAFDPAQRESNLALKRALQTAQIVLGQDSPKWGSSNIMPTPTGDISLYRGKLKTETANFIKTSSVKLGSSESGSRHKRSMAREGLATPDHDASVALFNSNRSLHDSLRQAGRNTRIIEPDGDDGPRYESSNTMPDLTGRLRQAKSAPGEDRNVMLRFRRSNVIFGDGRIKTLTTTQHDSMDKVVEATKHMEPGFNARIKQDPRYSSIRLGDDNHNQWTTSNKMPNWYAPESYDGETTDK